MYPSPACTLYRKFALLLLPWLFPASLLAQDSYIHVPFYSANLVLPTAQDMPLHMPDLLTETFLRQAYAHFEVCEYHPFLKKIGDYRRGMSLSDWHFYEILCRSADSLYPKESQNFRVLFQWFILRKSGIDARLFFTNNHLFLHAPSEEIEFGFYTIFQNGRRFVNLTARHDSLQLDTVTAFLPEAPPDGATMDFSMRIAQFPHMLTPQTIERLLIFTHKGQEYQLRIFLNRDYLQMMDDYPYYNQQHYFEVGLSNQAENSLLPALHQMIDSLPTKEAVELLLSFTRTAFFYLDDHRQYGREKPMTPEQTLYHSYSDCEDRSALFFYLCRQLLHLPAIVVDFQTHVGVAVELPDATGQYFDFNGRRYVYCEPTGPADVLKIGEMWPKIQGQKARVITEFVPK
jgi:hypothetical protein